MEKFSLEFKKVVSEKYLEGELSLKSVARMYGISPCTVRKWAYAYREHGISILTGKKGRYSAELKLTVVKEVVEDCFSVREVAVKHGIPAFDTVCNWLEKYRKYGECVFRSIRSRICIEVRSAIRILSINRELNFFYRFLTRFFDAFHYRGVFPQGLSLKDQSV